MPSGGRVHDRAILDALEALTPEPFDGEVWRTTRKGRDPLRGSGADGRWSASGAFEALYTSLTRDGSLAEIGYRLSLEPVWPSRIEHAIHLIAAQAKRILRFADIESLSPLGVDGGRYGSFDYGATQAIAAAAYFLEFDGLIVPSARSNGANLVIFTERNPPGSLRVRRSEDVDWAAWRRTQARG